MHSAQKGNKWMPTNYVANGFCIFIVLFLVLGNFLINDADFSNFNIVQKLQKNKQTTHWN